MTLKRRDVKRRNVKTGRKFYAELTRAGMIGKKQIAMARNRLKAKRGLDKIKDYRGELGTELNRQLSRLESGNADVRGRAALALGEIKNKKVVVPLIGALKDGNAGVRWGAALALGRIGDKRAVVPLVGALKDRNDSVRGVAAEALEKIKAAKQKKGRRHMV